MKGLEEKGGRVEEEEGVGAKEKDSLCWPLYKQAQQVHAPAFNTGE